LLDTWVEIELPRKSLISNQFPELLPDTGKKYVASDRPGAESWGRTKRAGCRRLHQPRKTGPAA
jgi:hypothetical protein